ncbi:GNAT family N-acetyltransferase [Mycobacteroides abscessus]|uniref:GNAT family N-acetyltransferase n=1 Tax=Mycobacteroides abscessus TaxID=36809 RepID=UPI000C264A19|nr:GNAT family N-acetyltransferase [Mycobacteroides abscessus]
MRLAFPREIRTERLLLRAASSADAAEQAIAIASSLPELRAWMPWAGEPQTAAQGTAGLTFAAHKFDSNEEFDWVIRNRVTQEFVGRVSVFAIDYTVPKCEIGYWLATAHTGNGYMREAVAIVLQTSRELGCRRVEIRCDSLNTRSARVAEKLGFNRDAVLKNDRVCVIDHDVVRDTLIFSKTQ